MKKRVLSIVLVLTMVASMFAGCGAEKTLECTDGGTVFNIYAWNIVVYFLSCPKAY